MTSRIFHGDFLPEEIARDLIAYFNRGNYQVQRFGNPENLTVQIATRRDINSGGQTALTASLQKVTDGVSVQLSNQAWFGLAASLGVTALSAIRNPLSLLGRIDDIAQDVESMQLVDSVWAVIDDFARQHGTGHALSERLRRTICPYCLTANPIASGRCIACGAPLGESQPITCLNCGFILQRSEDTCPNCGEPIPINSTVK
ncbi:MAG: zinc ribbon domain-containing protein [Anaerolineaceae bacterium]